jgi:hypothetical protein
MLGIPCRNSLLSFLMKYRFFSQILRKICQEISKLGKALQFSCENEKLTISIEILPVRMNPRNADTGHLKVRGTFPEVITI